MSDLFGAIDVNLASGVTGTLPVANGGTGATTFTANRVLLGNGTSAITTSSNLSFNTSTNLLTVGGGAMTAGLSLSGAATINPGGVTISSNQHLINATFSPTYNANSITSYLLQADMTSANGGTLTSNNYATARLTQTLASSTAASQAQCVSIQVTNSSPNVTLLYGLQGTITENATSGTLTGRTGFRMDVNKTASALDSGTGTGFQSTVADNSATGRWTNGYGLIGNVTNAVTGRGISATLTTSKGTGNSQYGIEIANNVSGSGVVVDNAYGINLAATASSSGVITNYYGIRQNTVPTGATNTYFLYNDQTAGHIYNKNSASLGVNSTGARLTVRGAGTTSGTTTLLAENSSGTDILQITDDGMSAFGTTPGSTTKLIVRGASSDTTTTALDVQRSSGTSNLKVRNDGKVAINNAAYQDALTVNGKVRADGLVLTNQTAVTSSGQLIYNNGSGGTFSGYMTLGDGTAQLGILPTMIERSCIDYNVSWTVGRTRAFWTVPARFDGWKIGKVYIEVSSIGSGAGDDELTLEISGVGPDAQIITAGSHTLVANETINTDDIVTFYVTEISATPAKGLNVSLELIKQ